MYSVGELLIQGIVMVLEMKCFQRQIGKIPLVLKENFMLKFTNHIRNFRPGPLILHTTMTGMRQYLVILFSLVFIVSCGKDKIETTPSIKITSVSGDIVPVGGMLSVRMDFTDKESDLFDLFVQKIRTNIKPTATIRDTFALFVPEFTTNPRGNIEALLKYQDHLISAINPGSPPNTEDDTLIIRFVLRDRAGHASDTVSAGTIIVLR